MTAVNLLHGSSNPIGGGNAVLKLRWGRDAAGLRFAGRQALASSSPWVRTRSAPAGAGRECPRATPGRAWA